MPHLHPYVLAFLLEAAVVMVLYQSNRKVTNTHAFQQHTYFTLSEM